MFTLARLVPIDRAHDSRRMICRNRAKFPREMRVPLTHTAGMVAQIGERGGSGADCRSSVNLFGPSGGLSSGGGFIGEVSQVAAFREFRKQSYTVTGFHVARCHVHRYGFPRTRLDRASFMPAQKIRAALRASSRWMTLSNLFDTKIRLPSRRASYWK